MHLIQSLLPNIKATIPNTPTQYGYKTQHYTVTARNTLNNTVAKGFHQMVPPAQTITVARDISKGFDTINIHTLIRKLLQTRIKGTTIKLIANYSKGRNSFTTYRNHTSSQRQFKTGVIPPPRTLVQVMVYADYTTITSTHTNTIPPTFRQNYLHTVHSRPCRI